MSVLETRRIIRPYALSVLDTRVAGAYTPKSNTRDHIPGRYPARFALLDRVAGLVRCVHRVPTP
eukprot:2490724-Rhodomonas_salina.1